VAYRLRDDPGPLTASADLRAFIGDGPGHIVAALHAAGVLPPDSPVAPVSRCVPFTDPITTPVRPSTGRRMRERSCTNC